MPSPKNFPSTSSPDFVLVPSGSYSQSLHQIGATRVGPPGCCHFTPDRVIALETDLTGPARPSIWASVLLSTCAEARRQQPGRIGPKSTEEISYGLLHSWN